jgi:BppU N-terminal domain
MAFSIKQGDRRPVFVVVLKDNFGEPGEAIVNLTTATSAAFNMRLASGGAVKINAQPATISNAAGGEVTYSWAAQDTDTVGNYEAEVEITWNDGKKETFPNVGYWDVVISDDIA